MKFEKLGFSFARKYIYIYTLLLLRQRSGASRHQCDSHRSGDHTGRHSAAGLVDSRDTSPPPVLAVRETTRGRPRQRRYPLRGGPDLCSASHAADSGWQSLSGAHRHGQHRHHHLRAVLRSVASAAGGRHHHQWRIPPLPRGRQRGGRDRQIETPTGWRAVLEAMVVDQRPLGAGMVLGISGIGALGGACITTATVLTG